MVMAQMTFNVKGCADLFLFLQTCPVRTDANQTASFDHLLVEQAVGGNDGVAAILAAVDERPLAADGQHGDGDDAKAAKVDEGHQRHAQLGDVAVEVALQPLELVARHFGSAGIVGIQPILGIGGGRGEFEVDVVHFELGSSGAKLLVGQRQDGALVKGQKEL